MCLGEIAKSFGSLAGVISLAIVIYDRAKKGAKIKAVVQDTELDGQTQNESTNGGPFEMKHYCIFTFGIRLENSGNEICTLTKIEINSHFDHGSPEIILNKSESYLKIAPGTSEYFSCRDQVDYVGEKPKSPIVLNVIMHFIGHNSVTIPVEFSFSSNMYR